MRIDRRVSPNQIGLWTVAELVMPTPAETPNAHPICSFRVSGRRLTLVIKSTKIRPSPGRETLGGDEKY